METETRIRSFSTASKKGSSVLGQFKVAAFRLRDATISQTGRGRWFLQVAWLIIYIALITCLLFQFAKLIKMYFDYPTDIDIEIISKSQLEFPAVTVCNENPLRKSLVGRIVEYEDLLLLDRFVMSSVQSFAENAFNRGQLSSCEENDHRCNRSGTCIPFRWVCNGISNCEDSSDEDPFFYNCTEIEQRRLNNITDEQGICAWPYIQCPGEAYCALPCDVQNECHWSEPNGNVFDTVDPINCLIDKCETIYHAKESPRVFSSKNYPGNYEADMDCTWTIKAPRGSELILTILDLQVEGVMGMCKDYIEIFDGSDMKTARHLRVGWFKHICGDGLPSIVDFFPRSQVVVIRFRSDSLLNERGFQMSYVASPRFPSPGDMKILDINETLELRNETLELRNETLQLYNETLQLRNETLELRNETLELRNETVELRKETWELGNESVRAKRSEQSFDYVNGDYYEMEPPEPNVPLLTTEEPWPDFDYNDWDFNYNYNYYVSLEAYETFVKQFDPHVQFYTVKPHDFYSLLKASELSDFSDFRLAVLFSKDLILYNGHQKQDFIVQCTYDGRKCDANFFKTFQEPFYGNCFSFNSIRDQNTSNPWFIRSSSKTGQEFGLKLTLFLDTDEYMGLLAPTAAVRAVIHDARTRPLVRSQSFAVGAGEATYISLRMNVIERQGGKYSNCADKWPNFLKLNSEFAKKWPQYDEDTCLYFCVINTMATRCNCTDSYEHGFSEDEHINLVSEWHCDLRYESDSRCRRSVYDDFRDNLLKCDCPHECETIDFAQRQSSGPWPTKAYAPYFASRMLESKSKRVIKYMKKMLAENVVDEETLQRHFRNNFARLEVFYEALNFQKISESSSYDVTALLSDFGGNLGLWLGWSVLILFEILQFLYECLEIIIKAAISCR